MAGKKVARKDPRGRPVRPKVLPRPDADAAGGRPADLAEAGTLPLGFLEHAADGMAQLSPDSRWVRVNERFCEMLGYSREEMVRLTLWDVTHPDDIPADEAKIAELLGGRASSYSLEKRYVGKDRRIVWAVVTRALVRSASGEPAYFITIAHEDTDRRKAEAEAESLARFPAENPNPVLRIAEDGRVMYRNKAATPLLHAWGCTEGRPVPEPWSGLVRDVLTAGQGRDAEAQCTGVTYLLAFAPVVSARYVNVYGHDITARKRAEALILKFNAELELRVAERTAQLEAANREMQVEIAERRRAEAALFEQARVQEAFLQHSVTPLVFLDPEFNFIRVNEAYAKACGRPVSDFPGRNHFELYPSDAKAIFEDVTRTRTPFHVTARPFVFADQPERGVTYWNWSLVPVLDEDGEVDFLVFSLEDVTEQKRAEQRIRATNELLQLFVRARSRKEYLADVVALLREMSGCPCVGVRVLNERGEIPYEATVGFSEEFRESECWLQVNRDQCACTRVVAARPLSQDGPVMTPGGSFCCPDTRAFVKGLTEDETKALRGTCVKTGFVSVAVVPIRFHDAILGAIHLASEQRGAVSLDNVGFFESIGPLIGEAIYRIDMEDALRASEERLRELNLVLARRASQLRELALDLTRVEQRERRRLAEVLHDDLQQLLAAAKLRVSMVQEGADPQARPVLGQVLGLLDAAISVSRSLTAELSSLVLYEKGLAAGLEWLGRQMQDKHGLCVHVEADPAAEPDGEDLRILLFQCVREALFNVVKHAGVSDASVRMTLAEGDVVQIEVTDEGTGFEPSEVAADGSSPGLFGLFSMRQRLSLLGGRVDVLSAPGQGTRVILRAPMRKPPEGGDVGAPVA